MLLTRSEHIPSEIKEFRMRSEHSSEQYRSRDAGGAGIYDEHRVRVAAIFSTAYGR